MIPVVSVILTSYNHEQFIREAIGSVLSQSFTDFELIIWDDHSTDDSWSIINSYQDGRIRTFRNASNTCGDYFDDALACTQGKYIAIHHSDDGWEPSKLAKQVQILDESPNVGACFTHVAAVDELGLAIGDDNNHYTSVFSQPSRSRQEWLRHFFFKGNSLCNPSVLIRRDCFASIGTFNLGLYQLPDLHLWIRLCLVHEIHIIPEKLVRFRIDTKGMSSQSAPTPANIIRHRHEMIHVLEAYRSIGLDDLLTAFPEAKAFEGIPKKDSNIDYMLAMLAVTSRQSTTAQRSFGAHLLTRCWMDSDIRQKLHSVHGLTRHQLLLPELLVDHSNSIQINNLTSHLQQVSIQLDQFRNVNAPSFSSEVLIKEIRQSNSLAIFKEIQNSIKERSFHLWNHILYDVRTVIGDKPCTYLEIGSYCGASALLMLAHPYETHILCVDPLILPPAHFGGTKDQDETLYENLSKLGKHQNFEIIKSYAQEASLIEALYRQMISVDILFIDGDHSYSSVISDFQVYEPLVASGGYIIFDDYHDDKHSPDVHHAVNELAHRHRDDSRFEIIGPIPDLQHCDPAMPEGNEFVIHKK